MLVIILTTFSFASTKSTDEKLVGVFYFTPIFGHVHQSSNKTSASLTAIQCSYPVKVIESSKVSASPEWAYVQVADHKGFILKQYLAEKRPDCFQGRYPKFFDALELDLTELYFWGRLYDQYTQGESRVQ